MSDIQMSSIEESVTDNCHFQRKGNENQYNHSVKVISNLKEVRSILENSDMNTQKFVAAKEKLSECINLVRTGTLHDDQTGRLVRFRLENRTRVPKQSHSR